MTAPARQSGGSGQSEGSKQSEGLHGSNGSKQSEGLQGSDPVYLELELGRTEGSLDPMLGRYPGIGVEVFLPQLVSEKLAVRLNGRLSASSHWQGDWLVVDELRERHLPLRLTIGED